MDFSRYSFLDGVIVNDDSFVFVGVDDERASVNEDHGIVWKYKQGEWHSFEIAEQLVSCATTDYSDYRFIAIAESGREIVIGDQALSQELVADQRHSPEHNGSLFRVCATADGNIYAIGAGRQVYKKESISEWVRLDQGCFISIDEEPGAVFTQIVSLTDASLCAVGWGGEIWLYRDYQWSEVSSPTNVALLCVTVASDGHVYAAGASGIVLRGRGECWEVLDNAETEDDILSIVEFNNRVYLGAASGLYQIQGSAVESAEVGMPIESVLNMSASSRQLLLIGEKVACLWDGVNLTTL